MNDIREIKFPAVVDSSMMGYFKACPQKFFRRHVENLVPIGISEHLHAGACFAKGMEAVRKAYYLEQLGQDAALAKGMVALAKAWGTFESPEGSNKTCERMLGALDFYFERYPLEQETLIPIRLNDTQIAVEVTFALPIPGTTHPETGDPILYAGRFDLLAERDASCFVVDEKTTTQLGPSWNTRWELRGQLTGYCWGAQQYGYPVVGAVIRGISILKTGYGDAQPIVYRPQWMIDRWLAQLRQDVNRMIECWREARWGYNFDESCAAFGGCPYLRLCTIEDPSTFIPIYYTEEKWDPLKFKD